MKFGIPERVWQQILSLAEKNGICKMILFGSRARGTNGERSDIDLAVSGGNPLNFYYDLEEEVWTLLFFDVVDLDKGISAELQREIDRDGVVMYEKV